ncbi:hypothetical protein LguiA_031712 [Lonicera macranthoides]
MDVYSSPQAEFGRLEQILSQFLLKSLHIILDSRVPSIRPRGRLSEVKKSDKWFSLVLGDRPAALENLNFWHKNLMEPMIIDIILVQEIPNFSSGQNSSTTSGLGKFIETVIERWVVQYEHPRTMSPQIGEPSAYRKTYKKSLILLRSLYSMMRLLPAHRAYRKLCSLSKACDFDINYKVSSFSAPFSRAEEDMMKQYNFVPVDAQQGRISISLTYRESLSDFNLETSALFPPQIITDYVGSPATDPLRAFPLSEKGGFCATSVPLRGGMIQSPTSTPFQRPHSWTSGLHGGAHLAPNHPILGGSPHAHHASSLKNEFSSSPTDICSHIKNQKYRMGNYIRRTTGFDDSELSPPFSPSPSPSPSPPTYGNFMPTRRRSETAPVSIPHPMMARSPRYLSPNLSDPSRHSLPPQSPKSITKHDPSSQESLSGIRSLRKSDSYRAGESYSGITNHYSGQKLSRDSKDDSGRFSGLLSSSGSPRIGFSRSSSRLSFQEDLDDFDFSCPFIVDDVDTSDSQASPNLDGNKASASTSQGLLMAKKSQDAAVGALVHMLRTAPPLRQDSSCYSSLRAETPQGGEFGTASEISRAKNMSDALEELRGYRELRDLLLSKSGTELANLVIKGDP